MSKLTFNEDNHEYRLDGQIIPSVTEVLAYIKGEQYKAINPSVLAYARQRGKEIHEQLEMFDLCGYLEDFPVEILGYLKAYEMFRRTYFPVWEYIEAPVYSYAVGYSGKLAYAGTVDRAGIVGGHKAVLDIKNIASPTRADKVSVCAQTAAYTRAVYGADDRTVKRYGLYLRSDGDYTLLDCEEFEGKNEFDPFALFDRCLFFYTDMKRLTEPRKRGK